MILQQFSKYARTFFMVQSSDHITPLTGATPTLTISRAGDPIFHPFGGGISEIGNGWYVATLSEADYTPEPPLYNYFGDYAFHVTATSGDPVDWVDQAQGQIFTQTTVDATGAIAITSNVKKNRFNPGFMFLMTDFTGAPKTGLTVSAQRSIDGNPFQTTANNPIEVGNGVYTLNFNPSDLNGNNVELIMSATGANPLYLTILPQP